MAATRVQRTASGVPILQIALLEYAAEERDMNFEEATVGMSATRCAGSDLGIGTAGDEYETTEFFTCPGCGQEVRVYRDYLTVRLRDHLRWVAA